MGGRQFRRWQGGAVAGGAALPGPHAATTTSFFEGLRGVAREPVDALFDPDEGRRALYGNRRGGLPLGEL